MIAITESTWYGFRQLSFQFKDRNALLICPHQETAEKKWLYKIEYFGAFPAFEIAMLNKGYYVAHVENRTRWAAAVDRAVWPEFCDFLINQWGLNQQCVPVGMSCGGMQAVYFASKHPHYVAALYLDAPVMNFLSCPYGLGKSEADYSKDFEKATGLTLTDMLNYREHPIDCADAVLANQIPIIIVSGDSDMTVPYDENGGPFTRYYREHGGLIHEIVKEGADHHPHGLIDTQPIEKFIERYY